MQQVLASQNPARIAEIPGLYISDITIPSSPPQLIEHGITHVLSLMSTPSRPNIPPELSISHKFVLTEDDVSSDLLGVLDEACSFIDSALKEDGKKVLVHCLQGISRSGAVVVAYVMKVLGLEYGEALELVRKYRSIVMPNMGFVEQLELWREMGYRIKKEDGEEKEMYRDWKRRSDEKVKAGEEGGNREGAKSLARLAARVGKMRKWAQETNCEPYADST